MRKFFAFPLTVLFLSFFCLSCATIFNSGDQTIKVKTSGAESVKALISTPEGRYETTLPTTIKASPSSFVEVDIKIIDERYYPERVEVRKTVTGSFFVNFLFWPGFSIDALTGSMWKYEKYITIPLRPKEPVKNVEPVAEKPKTDTKKDLAI